MTDLIPLGLHFGLAEDPYHADPALGSTDLKAIFLDAIEFQFDRLYGENEETPAKLWGHAFHARVLEGMDAFNSKYRIAPSKDAFKDLLVSDKEVREWLAVHGISTRGTKTKADRVALVRQADPTVQIWDVIMAQFEAMLEEGVAALPAKVAKEIELAVTWMQRHPKLSGVMQNGTFFAGAPEVSMFYEYQGVRLKARFDYLYPTLAVDLKSFRPWRPRAAKTNVIKAIEQFRYDLQAAAYRRAFHAARDMYHAGTLQVHGQPPTDDFVDLLFQSEQIKWIWVMVKAMGAPTSTLIEFPDTLKVFGAATSEVEQAIHIYKDFRDRYGDDADWMPEPDVIVLDDEDFPLSFGVYR